MRAQTSCQAKLQEGQMDVSPVLVAEGYGNRSQ